MSPGRKEMTKKLFRVCSWENPDLTYFRLGTRIFYKGRKTEGCKTSRAFNRALDRQLQVKGQQSFILQRGEAMRDHSFRRGQQMGRVSPL